MKKDVMSDNTASRQPGAGESTTVADVLRDPKPMGDPSRFAIDDLSSQEEDEGFPILENA